MTIDLSSFATEMTANDSPWASLGVTWTFTSPSPNHGKAIVTGAFESVRWTGQVLVWASGECELESLRLGDGWIVNKHYDLGSLAELETCRADLVSLLAQGTPPPGAVTAYR